MYDIIAYFGLAIFVVCVLAGKFKNHCACKPKDD